MVVSHMVSPSCWRQQQAGPGAHGCGAAHGPVRSHISV